MCATSAPSYYRRSLHELSALGLWARLFSFLQLLPEDELGVACFPREDRGECRCRSVCAEKGILAGARGCIGLSVVADVGGWDLPLVVYVGGPVLTRYRRKGRKVAREGRREAPVARQWTAGPAHVPKYDAQLSQRRWHRIKSGRVSSAVRPPSEFSAQHHRPVSDKL